MPDKQGTDNCGNAVFDIPGIFVCLIDFPRITVLCN